MVQAIGKVRYAFLALFGITVGLTAFFILLLVNTLPWELNGGAITLPLILGALTGGFVGGVIAHSIKNGLKTALLLVIPVWMMLTVNLLLWAISKGEIRAIPEIGYFDSYGQTFVTLPGYTVFYWLLPGIIVTACLIPTAILGGRISDKYVRIRKAPKKLGYKKKKGFMDYLKTPIFVIIFILAWVPLLVPLFSSSDNNSKPFSAWNNLNAGTESFRLQLEADGYNDVRSCITSYSMLSKIDEPFLLIVLGPNRFYNPVSDVPFMLKFLKTGGSILIAHEHGSTEWLMNDMFIASLPLVSSGEITKPFPFMFFADGILKDNASYFNTHEYPVITSDNLEVHPLTSGVDSIVCNFASGMMIIPELADKLGWEPIASSTSPYSWVDASQQDHPNGDGVYNRSIDLFDIPLLFSLAMGQYNITNEGGIPMGGFPIPVVAVTEFGNDSRIAVTSDASIFTNQMMRLPQFDNPRFALNTVNWLTRGNKSMPIIFDEAHIKAEGAQDASPAAIYGQFLDYVGYSSSNWFVAPFYPFSALSTIKKWLPKTQEQLMKEEEKSRRKMEKKLKKEAKKAKKSRKSIGKIQFGAGAVLAAKEMPEEGKKKKKKGLIKKRAEKKLEGILKRSTYFTQKLNWYLEQSEYNRALELLYNRVKRLIGKKIGESPSTSAVIYAIIEKFPDVEQDKLRNFFKIIDRVLDRGKNRLKVTKVESFESIYFQMITVQEYLDRL